MATSHVSFKSPNARIQRPANGKRSGAVCRSAGMTGSASFLLRWLFQEVLHFADQMHSVLLIGHEVRALGKHDHAAVLAAVRRLKISCAMVGGVIASHSPTTSSVGARIAAGS